MLTYIENQSKILLYLDRFNIFIIFFYSLFTNLLANILLENTFSTLFIISHHSLWIVLIDFNIWTSSSWKSHRHYYPVICIPQSAYQSRMLNGENRAIAWSSFVTLSHWPLCQLHRCNSIADRKKEKNDLDYVKIERSVIFVQYGKFLM